MQIETDTKETTRRALLTATAGGIGGYVAAQYLREPSEGAFLGGGGEPVETVPAPSNLLSIAAGENRRLAELLEGYDGVAWLGQDSSLTIQPGGGLTFDTVNA